MEVVQRSTQDHERREAPRNALVVEDDCTPFTSDKNVPPPQKSSARVLNQVASVISKKEYESDSFFMDSSKNCRAWYSSNYVTSKCRHQKEDTQFVEIRKRNYEVHPGMEKYDLRQTLQPTCHHFPPPSSSQRPPRTSIKTMYNKGCNMRYIPQHGQRSNCSYLNASTDNSAKIHLSRNLHQTVSTPRQKSKNLACRRSSLWML